MKQLLNAVMEHNLPKMQSLIDSGVNVNEVDFEWRTVLHYTALLGYSECAKVLLDNGARTDIVERNGKTALNFAETTELVGLGAFHAQHSNYPATVAAIRGHMTWQERIENEPTFHDRTC